MHRLLLAVPILCGLSIGVTAIPRAEGASTSGATPTSALDGRATALVLAPPVDWRDAMKPLLEASTESVAPLIEALERHPGGDGAQAAVAVLGAIGDAQARAELGRRLSDPDLRLSTEAALALGACGTEVDRAVLVDLAMQPEEPVRLRTAAVVAALRIRPANDLAELCEGIWLAGTDRRPDLRARFGLPDQSRWAFERTMILDLWRTLRGEAATRMDPDASFEDLQEQFRPMRTWLESR